MLTVAQPNQKQTMDIVRTAGGFLWWYADLRTPSGDGLVVIWSLGLPFLPGSRSKRLPAERPAVSVAHYASGKQQLYLLQDYPSDEADIDPLTGCARIGHSTYQISAVGDELLLEIELDEPIPSSDERLHARIRVTGPATALEPSATGDDVHVWAPKTVHAQGSATLSYAGQVHKLRGSAYVDSNVSKTPLPSQGITSWQWGRVSFPDYTLVYYEVEEADGARQRYLHRQSSGRPLERVSARISFSQFERGFYGLSVPRLVTIGGPDVLILGETVRLLEDGPFYVRGLVRAEDANGQVGFGFCETVVPSKIDVAWQRPLVKMRTHQVGGLNSVFLPLFSGPRQGRTDRLLSAFTLRRAAV